MGMKLLFMYSGIAGRLMRSGPLSSDQQLEYTSSLPMEWIEKGLHGKFILNLGLPSLRLGNLRITVLVIGATLEVRIRSLTLAGSGRLRAGFRCALTGRSVGLMGGGGRGGYGRWGP
ncbi:hypothetical protein V2J09_021481 [Rumex salicifolius]